jgi:hypothetical protein
VTKLIVVVTATPKPWIKLEYIIIYLFKFKYNRPKKEKKRQDKVFIVNKKKPVAHHECSQPIYHIVLRKLI